LTLEPNDRETRRFAVTLLAMAELAVEDDDSPLVAALIKELRAHVDELAYRLDSPGTSSLHVGAVAARLCQTVTVLHAHKINRPGPTAPSLCADPSSGLAAG
jgi:hypothetical protein